MEKRDNFTAIKTEKNKKALSLQYFPSYAKFILQNCLEDFAVEFLKISREEEVPLLKYLSSYSEKELIELGKRTTAELLTFIAENRGKEYIAKSTAEFKANRLPIIANEEILVDDITLFSFARRKTFRNFLKFYTTDPVIHSEVMEEVDRFTIASEKASFNAYVNVQQEKINRINHELQLQQQELLEAQQLAEMGSFFWDIKNGNSHYTPQVFQIFELSETGTFETFLQYVEISDRTALLKAIDNAINTDGVFECTYSYIKNNTTKRILSKGIVSFEEGKPVSMKGTIMDVTLKHNLLQRLQQSEELHKQAEAITHIGNWSWNVVSNEIVWSDEMYRIYGLAPQSEQITFERFMSLVHPDYRQNRINEIQQSLQTLTANDYLLKIVNPDGTEKILKGKGEVITDENNRAVKLIGTCQDITKEHQLNKELQEKEQNFKQLINNAPDAVIVIDENSIITLWNPKTEEVFGWKAEEAIGRDLTKTIMPPRFRDAHLAGIERVLKTGETHILNTTTEMMACDKNGREFYISLTISKTMQNGKVAFIAFLRDISRRKQTQLELEQKTILLEYKNVELERINNELESFNYAAGHDLQEPLRKIQTFSNRIIDKAKNSFPENIVTDFEKIIAAASRMQNLIRDLLTFSQSTSTEGSKEPANLNALIEEAEASLIHVIEENAAKIYVEKLPVVNIIRFQFLQLFINLISNAIKYRQENITPKIEISATITNSGNINIKDVLTGKNYLVISFADNGIGFEQEYGEKIFNLFTRLHNKDKYSGTGIGLAICKKIIHNHEGFISAESRQNHGTTFYIYLPEEYIVSTPTV